MTSDTKKCGCREPRQSKDCCYCGSGYGIHVCGVCRDAGIDGPVIKGTSRVVCKRHQRPDHARRRVRCYL